ncbi:MAG TPA: hypothetical protein VJW23_07215 [Propionibacteriaceae bacterium]|nr:hypothetical protein [Propionibacteriaceae bacterium]
MAQSSKGTLHVKGLREYLRAASRAEKETKTETRKAFSQVGEIVREEATRLFERVDAKSAQGYRTRVRQSGVSVEQSLRRVTGARPDYGSLQMREALLPALENKEHELEGEFDDAIDTVADHFEGGH